MKFLKGLLFTIIALVLVYLIIAIFAPSSYSVTRELTVNSSKEAVWNQINTFEKWQAWSPWKEKDSTLETTYEGTPGEVGSKSSWVGDPEISGTGNMTIRESVPNDRIVYDLEFPEWESKSVGSIKLEDVEDGTKVIWNDAGDFPFLSRPFMLLMDMDEMMGKDFERGLEKLATASANAIPEIKPIEISETELPTRSYLGIRHKTTIAEVTTQEFFATNYKNIFTAVGVQGIQPSGNSSCIFYSWNEEDSTAEAFPCVPIPETLESTPEGMEVVTIPAGKVVKATYYGAYEGGMEAHMKIGEYCKEKNLNSGLVIEEYVNAATAESEEDLITNIYYYLLEEN